MRDTEGREVIVSCAYTKARERLPQYHRGIDEKLIMFRQNPSHPSLHLHKVDRSPYEDWWSYRVNDDIRAIVSEQQDCWVVCYVGHHDDA